MLVIHPNWSVRTSVTQRRMQTHSRVSGSFELATLTLKRNWSIRAQTPCCTGDFGTFADSVMDQVTACVLGLLFCHVMTCKKEQACSAALFGCIFAQV